MSTMKHYIPVFFALLKTDLKVLKTELRRRIVDLHIWVCATLLVSGYLLPAFGVSASFGGFMAVSVIVSACIFEIFPGVMNLVSDFEGDRIISYYSTLPMPTSWVFYRLFFFYAIKGLILSAAIFPATKLVLGDRFDISNMNVLKVIIMYLLITHFAGAFTLWTASFVPSLRLVGTVWVRFVYPLWFLGGYQFTWKSLYNLSPVFAYIDLANPMIYLMEGMRGAFLGAGDHLPFLMCGGMSILFTGVFLYFAVKRLKRKLDFV